MRLVQFALSACLVVGSMAGLSSSAFAQGGYGGGHGGGQHSSGQRGGGQHSSGLRGGGRHGGGSRSRGHGRGGALVAGAVIGALVGGWNGGYGYPRAQHRRYNRYHRPYYAPQRRHGGGNRQYSGNTRGYYSYSGGSGYNSQAYQSRGGSTGCHPVNKIGNWNGRRANVGGTMCYNSYGTGYVVSGSRYLISYY